MSHIGKVVWHDLMCTDPEQGQKFYTELLGWTVQEIDMGPQIGLYRMLHNGEEAIGGIVPLDESAGVPSHWIGYVATDDIDACCQRVTRAGGQTCVPPTEIPDVGRFAVITDPAGAAISPFQGSNEPPPEPQGPPPAGKFVWDEVLTTDPDACKAFYGEVFGWTAHDMDMGPEGTYTVFKREGGIDTAGMLKMPPEAAARPHWIPYVAVADVDATTARIKEMGGINYITKEMPDVGRFSVNADPQGAAIALYRPKEIA